MTDSRQTVCHPIEPVFDGNSRILILGSFPSVRSREEGFFYGHPQNRFWRVTAAVFLSAVPQTVTEKRRFLLANGIALWDVIAQCEISGSSDSSIRHVIPNDLSVILRAAPIRTVFVNGAAAAKYYSRYQLPVCGIAAIQLPSTSPANAAWSMERLTEAWQVIRQNGTEV